MKLADLSAGVIIGNRFRLVKTLGTGSYGDVWLADNLNDDSLPPQVALKIYHHQERATRKLLMEALQAVDYQNDKLVKVFGADRIDGLVIMWLDYVPGKTLLQRLGKDSNPQAVVLDEILLWLKDIAEALAYLHAQDPPCVHGDLKLDNILLTNTETAVLTDFGQSRTIEDRFIETAGTGAMPYLTPEVLGVTIGGQGKHYVSSDIYAFGVIAYRALTGRFPRRSLPEIINLTPFPKPRELNHSIPVALEEIVWKCLDKHPDNRYPTGAALLAVIEQIQQELQECSTVNVPPLEETEPISSNFAEELAALAQKLVDDGQLEEAIERLEQELPYTPTSPKMLLVYAEAAKQTGKLETARLVYERVLHWLNAHHASDEEFKEVKEGLAELNVKMKRYEEAVDLFSWLTKHWPENWWYSYRLGISQGLAGKYQSAVSTLQTVYTFKPSALLCAKIGWAYVQLKEIDQACEYFNEALMMDEYEATALFHLARIRAIQGRTDRAMKYYERLTQVEGAQDQAQQLANLFGVAHVLQ